MELQDPSNPRPVSVRGINYFPSGYGWDTWNTSYQHKDVWSAELKIASQLGINTLRIFLERWTLTADRSRFDSKYLDMLALFLEVASAQGIRVVICGDRNLEKNGTTDSARLCWCLPEAEEPVGYLVESYQNDGRILLWDLANEPEVPDYLQLGFYTVDSINEMLVKLQGFDLSHESTVGQIDGHSDIINTERIDEFHIYRTGYQDFVDVMNRLSTGGGRLQPKAYSSILIGETGIQTNPETSETLAQQSDQVGVAAQFSSDRGLMGMIYWMMFDYKASESDGHWGLVRSDFTLKPAASVLKDRFRQWWKYSQVDYAYAYIKYAYYVLMVGYHNDWSTDLAWAHGNPLDAVKTELVNYGPQIMALLGGAPRPWLVTGFGYAKNARLVLVEGVNQNQAWHENWANGQTSDQVRGAITNEVQLLVNAAGGLLGDPFPSFTGEIAEPRIYA